MFKKITLLLSISISFSSCVGVYMPSTGSGSSTPRPTPTPPSVQTKVARNFPEGFDGASKIRYENGNITASSGQWNLDNAVMGGAENDQKNGTKAVRMKETAKLTMNFDCLSGIQQVRFKYGVYQLDKNSTFELWISTNAGNSWQQVGSTLTASEKSLRDATFNVNTTQAARIEIRKTDGSVNRLNIDDISIITYGTSTNSIPVENGSTVASRDDNLGLGNPSNAVSNIAYSDNFLMKKTGYTLSYNKNKNIANWVSWHLSTAWKGETERQNDFRPDSDLPNNWYDVNPRDYAETGFDRGHLCPSDDRDGSLGDNQETFLMTNIVPQAPDHNRGIWKNLEDYGRTLTQQGNEIYIIAGTIGEGGEGTNGFTRSIGKSKNIAVPASLWKIIVVLPIGQNDVQRINENTRIIAVNIPNQNSVGSHSWKKYRVSVDEIERLTGFDFLSNVPTDVQKIIEDKVDQ
ncbi:MAG: DNA/RNA non-specific endonuclease [Arcicella sp.]|nr:DNA/RNA non-specific endonuclease [Arcicella sp.]